MEFVPISDTARFELIWTLSGSRVENVWHIHRKLTAWTSTSLNTMCGKFVTWVTNSLKAQISTSASLVLIIGTDQTSKTSPRVEYSSGLPIAGTNAGTLLPNNVSVVASWRTANRGRSYRGRTFHLGMTATQVSASSLTAGAQTALQTAYEALMTEVNDVDHELVVASRMSNGIQRVTGVYTPITAVTIDPTLDSQRRRLPGRGI